MMPGRRFTTGAAAAPRGPELRKSHSDPYRTEGEGLQGDTEGERERGKRGEGKYERRLKDRQKRKKEEKDKKKKKKM